MCNRSKRSEEHTSELQSRRDLVCRLLLEKKNTLRKETEALHNCRLTTFENINHYTLIIIILLLESACSYRSFSFFLHLNIFWFFFFNDTSTTEIYTLSLHDALPIWPNSGTENAIAF